MRTLVVFTLSSLVTIVFFSVLIGLLLRKFVSGPALVFMSTGLAFAISAALRLSDASRYGSDGISFFLLQDLIAALLVGIPWLVFQKRTSRERGETK